MNWYKLHFSLWVRDGAKEIVSLLTDNQGGEYWHRNRSVLTHNLRNPCEELLSFFLRHFNDFRKSVEEFRVSVGIVIVHRVVFAQCDGVKQGVFDYLLLATVELG